MRHLPEEAVSQARGAGCLGISWTFNEPTLCHVYLGNVPGHRGENSDCHACTG